MRMRTWNFSGNILTIEHGDLLRADAKAIVNAANSRLAGGGGVDGAIQHAAGPQLLQAGLDHVYAHGPLPPGDAVVTPGFGLPYAHIIHTVGPIWRGGTANEATLLESAYTTCLLLAYSHGIESLAFPAISCGAYGYPMEAAAPIALRTLREGLEQCLVRTVRMVLREERTCQIWQDIADTLF